MDYQEYPKALYRDSAYLAVVDQDEEQSARADGYTDWHTDHARNSDASDAAADDPARTSVAETRDAMKVRATALRLAFKHNISNAALAELLAGAPKA